MIRAISQRGRPVIPFLRVNPVVRGKTVIDAVRRRCDSLPSVSASRLLQLASELREHVTATNSRIDDRTLTEAFSLMTESVRRATGKVYYDVQLLGGLALARGAIAEMQTGEGKTLTTGLPAFAHSLTGRGVHVATTNAYLAERDRTELKPAFELLGLSVGLLPDEHDHPAKLEAYQSDITYGTGYEFGFDFLRDQIALRKQPEMRLGTRHLARVAGMRIPEAGLLQRGHTFAIVDEADSVLIDEATMPLILSMSIPDSAAFDLLTLAKRTADELIEDEHFIAEKANRTLEFTEQGWTALHEPLHRNASRGLKRPWSNYVEQALRAKLFLVHDVDYVIVDDEIQIVDQHTGRIHPERSWRDGLHQAIEIREGISMSPEKSSEGRVSRQHYFQHYDQLCGMTGTATGNEFEFREFYGLQVVKIPTHRPCRRRQDPSRFFSDGPSRDAAIADEVCRLHGSGQPVLVGTRTIRHSRQLAARLEAVGLPHAVLNGVQDEDEAAIVSRAGRARAVTIATNMAGRGTDIKPDARAVEAGGLHVIAAEHNTSRRVDRQLAGRAARQGDEGSVQFFVSADDELFIAGESSLPDRIRKTSGDHGESQTRFEDAVQRLQDHMERKHFERRREMVQRDNWMESVLETLAKRG